MAMRRAGSGAARRPAANNAKVCVQMFDFRFFMHLMMHIDPSQAGDLPDDVFEDRPQPARLVEALVVETDRQEAIEFVEDVQGIPFERRPGVLMADDLPVARGLDAGAHVGPAVHVHQAIGALAGNAEQAARPMVLEAAREHAHAACVKRGRDALASQRGNGFPFEADRDRPL